MTTNRVNKLLRQFLAGHTQSNALSDNESLSGEVVGFSYVEYLPARSYTVAK